MTDPPQTRYVTAADGVNIAYQVLGEGDGDLVFVPGWISNLDLFWEVAATRRFFERLATFARLILFDKRGTGLSDPIDEAATLEQRMADLRLVMDAAGSERAAVIGYSEGGAMAALFAATYPRRVSKLVLLAPAVAPALLQPMWNDDVRAEVARGWGEGALVQLFLPNHAGNPRAREAWARSQRMSMPRGMALKYWDLMGNLNALDVLPSVTAPTLVLGRDGDVPVPLAAVEPVAAAIPGSRLVVLRGNDHLPWLGDWQEMCDVIQEFVTGRQHRPDPERVLSTVLFTDIVNSTQRASALGDRRWRDLLEEHDRICREEVERHGGRLVKGLGDGVLATFDGPARGIRTAVGLRDALGGVGIEVRAGLHTGECEMIGDDIGGVAVHIAARVSATAGTGEVLVSRTVKDLIAGSGVRLDDRGAHEFKGIPDSWNLYAVVAT